MWPGPVYTDQYMLHTLFQYPNFILWMAGHRHVNVVTLQVAPSGQPSPGFWEVETCSLRDFPQQLRTFDIRRNADNTVSILVTNVDPAVQPESPAYKSRDTRSARRGFTRRIRRATQRRTPITRSWWCS